MSANATLNQVEPVCVAAMPGASVLDVRELFDRFETRHLPVADTERHVVGMVGRRDVAQAAWRFHTRERAEARQSLQRQTVEQIMSRQVLTLDNHELTAASLRAMVASRLHAVPVTSAGRLVGMVRSTDFLKKLAYGQWDGVDCAIRKRMRSPGHTVDADETLERALEVAEWHAQEFIVVVRRYRPLGILSRTAMRLALFLDHDEEESEKLKTTKVRHVVQSLPVLHPEQTLAHAALEMLEHRARALAVVERSRLLLGILTEDDVLAAMVDGTATASGHGSSH